MRWRLLLAFAVWTAGTFTSAADLKPFVRGSWQAVRQSHAGKPTIVHFWGLSCAPCLTELPSWAAVLRERGDLVLVAVDGSARDVSSTLAKAGLAGAENWIFADRFEDRLRFEVDPNWGGELPMTMFIEANGKASSTLGLIDVGTIRAWTQGRTATTVSHPRSRATVMAMAEASVVAPGSVAEVVLHVMLPANLHVQSDHPRQPSMIPSVLTVDPPAGVSVQQITYPPPIDLRQAGIEQPLSVFQHDFQIHVRFRVARDVRPGELKIPVHLRYQACDERVCYPPETSDAMLTLHIGS